MIDESPLALLGQRFGQVHRVFDYGDNGQAWIADPGFVGARALRELFGALRPRLYLAELAWSGGHWCVEVGAFDPRTGCAVDDRHNGITPFESQQRAQSTLRAWALLLAGKFDAPESAPPP